MYSQIIKGEHSMIFCIKIPTSSEEHAQMGHHQIFWYVSQTCTPGENNTIYVNNKKKEMHNSILCSYFLSNGTSAYGNTLTALV